MTTFTGGPSSLVCVCVFLLRKTGASVASAAGALYYPPMAKRKSALEEEMNWQLVAAGFVGFERQVKFTPFDRLEELGANDRLLELAKGKCRKRVYHFDFADKKRRLYIEVDGGSWVGGGHGRGVVMESDRLKSALALVCGWRGIRVTSNMVHDGRALTLVEAALSAVEGAVQNDGVEAG